ncbi:hypothetical protein R3W88_004628 [Solanum pinnatisectum]|uniref:Uncharacterized protein n=1 Tax=Solanum pinnatisectum TaxID=50273 RepID=A0AAV9KBS6_9SOLN|nr:hypothetical protein R3W88_004628 [Solanum pinnatisectum]
MLGSQGLQDSIIGNTNFWPAMTLNNEDNHTEKNYNFDLNLSQGATYSGSRIVSSTYIEENAIINNYNLNVIADNVTTYSSSAMISDTYVENVTICHAPSLHPGRDRHLKTIAGPQANPWPGFLNSAET